MAQKKSGTRRSKRRSGPPSVEEQLRQVFEARAALMAAHTALCDAPSQKIAASVLAKDVPRGIVAAWDKLSPEEQNMRVLFSYLLGAGKNSFRKAIFRTLDKPIHATVFYDERPAGIIFSMHTHRRGSIVVQFAESKKTKIQSIHFTGLGIVEEIFPPPRVDPEMGLALHQALHQVLDYARFKFPQFKLRGV